MDGVSEAEAHASPTSGVPGDLGAAPAAPAAGSAATEADPRSGSPTKEEGESGGGGPDLGTPESAAGIELPASGTSVADGAALPPLPQPPPPGSLRSMLSQDDYLTRLERRILKASGGAVEDHKERSFHRGAADRLRELNDSVEAYRRVAQDDGDEEDDEGDDDEDDEALLDGALARSDSPDGSGAACCCDRICGVS